jgi:hypothetical protein
MGCFGDPNWSCAKEKVVTANELMSSGRGGGDGSDQWRELRGAMQAELEWSWAN